MPYKDPEVRRQKNLAYKAARRGELAAKQRDYYQRTRPERDRQSKAYKDARPELHRLLQFANRSNARAAAINPAAEKLFAKDLKALVGPCFYCGVADASFDHVIPLVRGGRNHVSNLTPCCTDCNKRKGDRTPEEWLR